MAHEVDYAEMARHVADGSLTGAEATDAARLLEDEIERRVLKYEYSNALVSIIGYQATDGPLAWAILRATHEQRARAFLEVAL